MTLEVEVQDSPPKSSNETTLSHFAQMIALENYDSPQIKIVSEFVRGFRESDPALLAKHLHKDFRRIIHPRSLGVPEVDRDEWLKNVAGVLSITTQLETINHSVTEAPGTVIVHATTKLKSSSGVDVDRESIYITTLVTDEDGNLKIKQSEEFTDSKAYLDLFNAAAEAKAGGASLAA